MTQDCRAITPRLTPRQEEILDCISLGMTNREIGQHLGLAEQTVKNSITDILAVLGLRRRVQAAVYATTTVAGRAASRPPEDAECQMLCCRTVRDAPLVSRHAPRGPGVFTRGQ